VIKKLQVFAAILLMGGVSAFAVDSKPTVEAGADIIAQSHNFTESGVYTAAKTGHQTTTNACGDARCVELIIYLPLTAQNIKPHCYVNIKPNTTDDLPHGQLAEVGCGVDTAWSIFDKPTIQTTPTNVVVRTMFHNRSHNRDRDTKLVAEWTAAGAK
jgi:hypothetical protein